MILLDTSVLIDNPLNWINAEQEYAASILSRAELEFGVAIAQSDRTDLRRHRLADYDRLFAWLPFTEATTRAYGILARAIHPKAPAQARRIDTYIAAHALELGIPLMTANAKDLRHIAHLISVIACDEVRYNYNMVEETGQNVPSTLSQSLSDF